uniref:sunset domain-containing protein n=1 Tax=Arachnia propionica TaxID=1750 RepID=UPI0030C69A52
MKKSRLAKAAAEQAAAAAETSRHFWDEAVEKAAEMYTEAQRRAVPAARRAGKRTADFASRRLDNWEPHIRGAISKVSPAVDAATGRLTDQIIPNLQDRLHKAAGHVPVLAEVIPPAKKKRGVFKTIFKFALIGTAMAGAVAAVRHFLTPKDDGWTAHEPSRAYINNNDTFATAAKFNEPPAEPAASASQEKSLDFGEGSYVGPNPPEGYIVKGNGRSRKYHVPGTRGYELTIAEVWFNSEEAAEAAGFTKAQR